MPTPVLYHPPHSPGMAADVWFHLFADVPAWQRYSSSSFLLLLQSDPGSPGTECAFLLCFLHHRAPGLHPHLIPTATQGGVSKAPSSSAPWWAGLHENLGAESPIRLGERPEKWILVTSFSSWGAGVRASSSQLPQPSWPCTISLLSFTGPCS